MTAFEMGWFSSVDLLKAKLGERHRWGAGEWKRFEKLWICAQWKAKGEGGLTSCWAFALWWNKLFLYSRLSPALL